MHKFQVDPLINYADDNFSASITFHQCAETMHNFIQTCNYISLPIEPSKCEGPARLLTYLGILIDSVNMLITLPPDKLQELLNEIQTWLDRDKCTKVELQSLVGKLSWATKVLPVGRIFLRRLIDATVSVKRPLHHVRVTQGMREDMRAWLHFLNEWDGAAYIIDPRWTPASELTLQTDASGSYSCAAFNGSTNEYFVVPWPGWIQGREDISITWKEFVPVLLSCIVWASSFYCKRIRFLCDNQAVIHIWNSGSCKNKPIMNIVRRLFAVCAKANFTIGFSYIRSADNSIADALSRGQTARFNFLTKCHTVNQVAVPDVLSELAS